MTTLNGHAGPRAVQHAWQPAVHGLQPGIDFPTVARELRCEGIRVEHPEQLRPVLEPGIEAGRAGRPTPIDVVIHPRQYLRDPHGF